MGLFSRFKTILKANLGSNRDNSEDPEETIRIMIREIESTLTELKTSCAGAIAECRDAERRLEETMSKEAYWGEKAGVAVEKGRDDLAREALVEKRKFAAKQKPLRDTVNHHREIVNNYKDDIFKLEEKLKAALERRRMLMQRRIHAGGRKHAHDEMKRIDSSEAVMNLDEMESRIELMEAEAEMARYGRDSLLEKELEKLEMENGVETELEALKSKKRGVEKTRSGEIGGRRSISYDDDAS